MKSIFLAAAALLLACSCFAEEVVDVYLTSSFDGKTTWSKIMIPDGYEPGSHTPVVVSLHGAGGGPGGAIRFARKSCNSRGWFVAAPHTHGRHSSGEYSMGTLPAQHDIIDLLDYMKDAYSIDEDRIYISGGSMGGGTTTITAEKYPHVFAAAFEWMGAADVAVVHGELEKNFLFSYLADSLEVECGGTPEEVPFEYARISGVRMAMNLVHVPFKIGHGRLDLLVLPHHAEDLAGAIETFDPLYFDGIRWFFGGHLGFPFAGRETCEFFEQHVRMPYPAYFLLTVDESKNYYCAEVRQRREGEWSRIGLVQKPDLNGMGLAVVNGDVLLRLSEMYLDPAAELSIRLYHPEPLNLALAGMDGAPAYEVLRNDLPFENFEFDGDTLFLFIENGSPAPVRFTIIPVR